MFEIDPNACGRKLKLSLAVSLLALMSAAPAFGQGTTDPAAAPQKNDDSKRVRVNNTKPSSPNATVNLVNALVKQGVLKQEQADALIKQAEDEAYVSRQASKDANTKADDAAKAATAAAAAANPPGTRHVTYVPEVVKEQLREQIKQEVMARAEKENWASPGAYPEWAQRIHFYGDFRARYQGSFFPTGNDQIDAINFNAINTGSPFDTALGNSNPYNAATYNTSQQRNQVKLRARLGMDADLTNGFDVGIRIATGSDNSPVSTNQVLGGQNSSGASGDFAKYQLWLDRGYLKWSSFNQDVVASVGRFDNPFWSPTDLVWYDQLGFDGVAFQIKHEVSDYFAPFAVAGAFPIFNTSFNLSTNLQDLPGNPSQVPSHDKWLYGGQLGAGAHFDEQTAIRIAAAYYDFENVQGMVSQPCIVATASDICGTDLTRPFFAQKGNTYMALRNIIADPTINQNGTTNQFQFFGLVQKYRPVVASAEIDFSQFNPYHIIVDGEFVWNSAFNRSLVQGGTGLNPNNTVLPPGVAINNRAGTPDGSFGAFNGGDQGWMVRLTVGNKDIKHFGDWNVHAGYKYLESDATLDAFVDSDFGLGGTNLKGYLLGGNVGLSENVWASARWLSATNIAGTPYAVDVLLVDVNARF
jgi:hypothetical protein